tara:strand:- start:1449 stop:1691 length:243 start_codon:yes stop_codon:yes gene_type:complete
MTLIMTSERCPECDATIYMVVYPKHNIDGDIGVVPLKYKNVPHTIADGIYLDRDSTLCIVQFEKGTIHPDYYCLVCQWRT